MSRRVQALFLIALAWAAAGPAQADGPSWTPFDALDSGNRAIAQAAIAPRFGDNPVLWPDWLDPEAVLIPSGNQDILVVREPLHAPCGQFGFIVFGPVTNAGTRDRLDGEFCAGSLTVMPVWRRVIPDLLFAEGNQQDPATGEWQRHDQRVRWTGGGWLEMETPKDSGFALMR